MPNLTPYQLEALNHKKHISLTANAGSGKTFVLARRFLSILIQENIQLNNIVAITFTDKAAAELYKKIADELDNRIKESGDSEIVRKLERIRRQLVSAKISTIHSFCTDLLKEFSPEAGVDANFTPIDKNTTDELITTTIEEFISETIKNKSELFPDLKQIIHLFGSRNILSQHLKTLIGKRSIVIKLNENLYSKSEVEIEKYFSESFEKYFKEIFDNGISSVIKQIEKVNNLVLQNAKNIDFAEKVDEILNKPIKENIFEKIITLNKIFTIIITGKGTVRSQSYLSKKLREEVESTIEEIENFADEIKAFNFTDNYKETEHQLAKFGLSIINLWEEILLRYEQKKDHLGYLDFEDLLLVTQKLLERKDVIKYLAEQYQYFMIDEYQDTNETQYNIFIPILDYLKRGNLFIVGDEKQSIYMFRGADLEVFNKTKNDIKDASDKKSLLNLPHSFRLSPELTLLTNALFSRLFNNPSTLFNEVEYNELICAREESDVSEIEFLISEMDEESDNESELIAKKIVQLTQQGVSDFKDIAILSRKRRSFSAIEKELVNYNIPYLVFGGKGFFQRQEIYDVFNYLSFLVNPNNDAALIGILRSPFFSVSDTDIFELSLEAKEKYFEKLILFAEKKPNFKKILKRLEKHIQLSKTIQISLLIREILMDTGYWVVLSSKNNSGQYISNIEKLITTANNYFSKGLKTLFDFVNYLEDAINSSEDESQAALLSTDNAVKLMTIHAAKGLEFPIVILIDTNSKGMDDRVKSRSISVDKKFGILTKTPDADNYFSEYQSAPIVSLHNYIIQKKAIAELKRLLYVGVTRAQNSLYITASIKRNKEGILKPPNGSFLALFKEGLLIDDFSGTVAINGQLNFMLEKDQQFNNVEKSLSLSIPIINHIKIEKKNEVDEKELPSDIVVSTESITDFTKNEIISATKIAVFNQCPFKYYLIYELGYSALNSLANKSSEIDYSKEDSDELSANIKGSIVHKLLEEETQLEVLRERIISMSTSFNQNPNSNNVDESVDSIFTLVSKFYQSKIFKELKQFSKYKNEYEIYAKINDYFIYGIIDKVVFKGNEIQIFDYKTDSLSKSSLTEKLENYRPQLTFYALLISKLFDKIDRIKCSLIFVENPYEVPSFEVNLNQLSSFEKELNRIVSLIRNGKFKANTSHCKSCYFSNSENECVVKH